MSDSIELPNIPGYVSIKEAAKILGLADRTVYEYVEEGRLQGVKAADVIMIPLEDVYNFKRGTSGRPRKNTPPWRISSGNNEQFMLVVSISIKAEKQGVFQQKLEEIRRQDKHLFPGTVVRSIMNSKTKPGEIVIVLVWRGTVMPSEAEREKDLEAFRQEFAELIDWSTAQYDEGIVLMHT